MCSIFGLIRAGGLRSEDRWLLRDMADHMVHRGPDGSGFHLAANAGIGMTRLAIIDLQGGWQPIYNEDRTIAVVCNGEIYNFVELRAELESRGHVFSTKSDCETVVHLYEEFGAECVHRLRGMFALAVLDLRNDRMLIARDRMGEKPLTLVERPDGLVFCSELAGLVGAGAVPFELDEGSVHALLHWEFLPDPLSPVRGVRKLGAGCLIEADLRTGRWSERTWWRLDDAPPIDAEPVQRIREELDVIAGMIIRSDVPIGVGLSGGVDSSAIAAMAKRCSHQPVTCFTVGYEGDAWQDERPLAREFARHLGLPLHEVALGVDRMVRDFPQTCLRRDDPVADISAPSQDALLRMVREHDCPVLLTGHGGDELFWGYPWIQALPGQNARKRRMLAVQAGLLEYLRLRMPPMSAVGCINWLLSGAGALDGLHALARDRRTPPERLVFWDALPAWSAASRAIADHGGERLAAVRSDAAASFTGAGFWDDLPTSIVSLECATYLRCNGLLLSDRLSMANSIEGRAPLSDYRLAEVVVGLRKRHDDLGLPRKAWLRGALQDLVPPFVFQRRKRGFTPPWRLWNRRLWATYGQDLEGGWLQSNGILSARGARDLRRGFDLLRRPLPTAYHCLVLEQWARGMQAAADAARTRLSRDRGEPTLQPSRHLA